MKEDDMVRMQQDAIRRVQEMQKRARRAVTESNRPPKPEPGPPPPPRPEPKALMPVQPPEPPARKPLPGVLSKLAGSFLGGVELSIPVDTLILVGLILLLGREEENMRLVLALAYILL